MKQHLTRPEFVATSRSKLEECQTTLKGHRESLITRTMVASAHDMVDKAEAALLKTSDAEMPFLKGIEVLPQEEAAQLTPIQISIY